MPKISVVSPVYGCKNSLDELYTRVKDTLLKITEDFEIIFVNDASPDNAWETIREIVAKDNRVKGINLSRNFGQHKAIAAGIDHSQGDWVVVMDCDLQDRPEEIIKLYNKAQEGYDAVFGQRVGRQDSRKKRWTSRAFITVYDYLSDSKTDPTIGNYSIISRKVANALKGLSEQHRPYTFFVIWLGFKRTYIEIEHAKRTIGTSSYNFKRLVQLAVDNIVSQSNKLLRVSIKFGFILASLSALYAFYLVIKYYMTDEVVPGWTSVMVSIYFIGGLLFANLGLIGLYIGKVFDETKNRPLYIVDEII
jgi:dolichol-phosphate mannosyltransferase